MKDNGDVILSEKEILEGHLKISLRKKDFAERAIEVAERFVEEKYETKFMEIDFHYDEYVKRITSDNEEEALLKLFVEWFEVGYECGNYYGFVEGMLVKDEVIEKYKGMATGKN